MRNNSKNIIEFTLIYNQFKTRVYNYALKMLYDKMQCEDIVQNAFVKLYENFEGIRNRDSIQYWLFTTVRNEIYSFFRSKRIHVDQFNVDDSDEIERPSEENVFCNYENMELRELILAELDKMSIGQRDVFLLKEYGGLSYQEIAKVMGIGEDLVKSRLHKTRQKLIKNLSPLLT